MDAEESLFAFMKKGHSGPRRKTRPSSKQQKAVEDAVDDLASALVGLDVMQQSNIACR